MRAGALRHSITIQQKSESRDAFGGVTVSWTTFATAYAAVEPLSGRELVAAQAVQSEITGKVSIRYIPGVIPKMRVLFGARVLDIKAVIDYEERHREMILLYSEGLTDG